MKQSFIPLSVPNLKGNELKYVTKAVETEWVSTGGPYVTEFEQKVANYVHSPGAVSCQNGTSGLHVSLLLAGVTSQDIVIVPTLTFIAAVNPVRYIGAEPIFMDCDDSLGIDADKLELYFTTECELVDDRLLDYKTKKHIKAIIVVHVFGNMANLEKIIEIAKKYHVTVIEDATEAIGTYYTEGPYRGEYAGTLGAMGVFSFNGNKIITTGGGGMIVSKDSALLGKAKHLTTQAKTDEINFLHDEVAYNYRLTNLQAALGLAQMEQLESFITIKTENYRTYQKELATIPHVHLLPFRSDVRSNYWFYSLYIEDDFPLARNQVVSEFAKDNIQTRPIWGLIHQQKPYTQYRAYKIEKAKDYQDHVVNLPCSSNLSISEVNRVIESLKGMVT